MVEADSFSDIKDIIERYSYFIFDSDGVLWHGSEDIEHAREVLKAILEHPEKKIFFMSNNAMKSRRDAFLGILKHLGIEEHSQDDANPLKKIHLEDVYNSAFMTCHYLKNVVKPKKMLVSGEAPFFEELKEHGLTNFVSLDDLMKEKGTDLLTEGEFQDLEVDPQIDCVVLTYQAEWNHRWNCYASLCLQNGAKFVVSNCDTVFMLNSSTFLPDIGSMARALQAVLPPEQGTPTFCGKPEPLVFDKIASDHGLSEAKKEDFLMIGDNLETDIKFGTNVGIDTLLVLTGVSKREEIVESNKPTHILPTLGYSKDKEFLDSLDLL